MLENIDGNGVQGEGSGQNPNVPQGQSYQPGEKGQPQGQQHDQAGAEGTGQQTQQTSTPLTEQQVLDLVNKAVGMATEKAVESGLRKFQSLSDKAEARVNEQLAAMNAALEASGIQLTPQQRNQMEGNIRDNVRKQSVQGTDQGMPAAQLGTNGPSPAVIAKVNEQIALREIDYGTSVVTGDPEYDLVDWQSLDHLKVLKQHEAAIKAKAARIQSQSATPQNNSQGGANNVVAGSNQGQRNQNKIDPKASPDELLDQAFSLPK